VSGSLAPTPAERCPQFSLAPSSATLLLPWLFSMYGRSVGDGNMQDISETMRNIFLVGLISLGAPIAGCTVVDDDDDDADVQLQADDLEDDEDIEVEIED
jgi:hypothetical protein